MKVYIPTSLRSYTHTSIVDANGATLAELLIDLDRQFPGLRFRIVNEQDELREHIKLFVDQRIAQTLDEPLKPNDVVRIIMAISGGASARKP
jgi:molybdopterin converting factor small subunit